MQSASDSTHKKIISSLETKENEVKIPEELRMKAPKLLVKSLHKSICQHVDKMDEKYKDERGSDWKFRVRYENHRLIESLLIESKILTQNQIRSKVNAHNGEILGELLDCLVSLTDQQCLLDHMRLILALAEKEDAVATLNFAPFIENKILTPEQVVHLKTFYSKEQTDKIVSQKPVVSFTTPFSVEKLPGKNVVPETVPVQVAEHPVEEKKEIQIQKPGQAEFSQCIFHSFEQPYLILELIKGYQRDANQVLLAVGVITQNDTLNYPGLVSAFVRTIESGKLTEDELIEKVAKPIIAAMPQLAKIYDAYHEPFLQAEHFTAAMFKKDRDDHVETINSNLRGKSPLEVAIEKGYTKLIKFMMENGADCINPPVPRDKGYGLTTPLHKAVKIGKLDLVQLFVEAKADINYRAKEFNYSVLEYAVKYEYKDIVKYLLSCQDYIFFNSLHNGIDHKINELVIAVRLENAELVRAVTPILFQKLQNAVAAFDNISVATLVELTQFFEKNGEAADLIRKYDTVFYYNYIKQFTDLFIENFAELGKLEKGSKLYQEKLTTFKQNLLAIKKSGTTPLSRADISDLQNAAWTIALYLPSVRSTLQDVSEHKNVEMLKCLVDNCLNGHPLMKLLLTKTWGAIIGKAIKAAQIDMVDYLLEVAKDLPLDVKTYTEAFHAAAAEGNVEAMNKINKSLSLIEVKSEGQSAVVVGGESKLLEAAIKGIYQRLIYKISDSKFGQAHCEGGSKCDLKPLLENSSAVINALVERGEDFTTLKNEDIFTLIEWAVDMDHAELRSALFTLAKLSNQEVNLVIHTLFAIAETGNVDKLQAFLAEQKIDIEKDISTEGKKNLLQAVVAKLSSRLVIALEQVVERERFVGQFREIGYHWGEMLNRVSLASIYVAGRSEAAKTQPSVVLDVLLADGLKMINMLVSKGVSTDNIRFDDAEVVVEQVLSCGKADLAMKLLDVFKALNQADLVTPMLLKTASKFGQLSVIKAILEEYKKPGSKTLLYKPFVAEAVNGFFKRVASFMGVNEQYIRPDKFRKPDEETWSRLLIALNYYYDARVQTIDIEKMRQVLLADALEIFGLLVPSGNANVTLDVSLSDDKVAFNVAQLQKTMKTVLVYSEFEILNTFLSIAKLLGNYDLVLNEVVAVAACMGRQQVLQRLVAQEVKLDVGKLPVENRSILELAIFGIKNRLAQLGKSVKYIEEYIDEQLIARNKLDRVGDMWGDELEEIGVFGYSFEKADEVKELLLKQGLETVDALISLGADVRELKDDVLAQLNELRESVEKVEGLKFGM